VRGKELAFFFRIFLLSIGKTAPTFLYYCNIFFFLFQELIFLLKRFKINMVNFMKKICIIFFIIIFSVLSGCSEKNEFSPPAYAVIEEPTDYTASTVDGYRDYNYKNDEKATVYYGNKNSKVFHHSDCTYAMKMNETSIIFEYDREAFISKGYTPCGSCNP
jgi:hypothetical protein